jgi:hypothetical protein
MSSTTVSWPMNRTVLLKAYRKALRELNYSRLVILRATNDHRAFCPCCAGCEPPVISAMSCHGTESGFGFQCARCETRIEIPRPVHNWSLAGRLAAAQTRNSRVE